MLPSAPPEPDLQQRPPAPLRFGRFVLHPAQKLLLEHGQQVRLGSRALDILTVLAERPGTLVSRDELVARVWPRTVVEETSLRVHVSALRKALGERGDGARYITNVPGRGYSFVAPVEATLANEAARPPSHAHNLPTRLNRLIGRSDVIASLSARIGDCRLISIVGPGGMGKTSVALSVAEQSMAAHRDGVRFVDLAPLADPALVPAALAATLDIAVPACDPWPVLTRALRDQELLIVLDNCEHVIDAAALLADGLLKAAPRVRIIATSRVPLETEGEWVHRLSPLGAPMPGERLTPDETLRFPAVQLFVERAMAQMSGFAPDDAALVRVRQLCRHLDGIPLAIELAAARVDTLGVQGLADRLDDLFRVLTRGRRTALPRHRTLQALIDWSHDLLTDVERTVLRRLSIFRAGFTMAAAAEVAGEGIPDFTAALTSLAAQSLVAVDSSGNAVLYRLLHTTRAYAAARLRESDEHAALARRHAVHIQARLAALASEPISNDVASWVPGDRHAVDDIRAAVDWALVNAGDVALGVSLAAMGMRAAYATGMVDEQLKRIELALDHLPTLPSPDPRMELRLYIGLTFLTGYSVGLRRSPAEVFKRACALADLVGDTEDRVELRYALSIGTFGQGDYAAALHHVEHLLAATRDISEALHTTLGQRIAALVHHYRGEHAQAGELAQRVMARARATIPHRFGSEVPCRVSMRVVTARILWLEGHVDQAVGEAAEALRQAADSHPFAWCQALGMAGIPIAAWRGDDDELARLNAQLCETATRHALGYWIAVSAGFARVLALRGKGPQVPLDESPWPLHPMVTDLLATQHESFARDTVVTRALGGEAGWCAAEVLRARGDMLLLGAPTDPDGAATALFEQALHLARQQGALSWELRASCSQAAMWHRQGRTVDALSLLDAIHVRLTEGFDTADHRRLRALRATLALPDRPR